MTKKLTDKQIQIIDFMESQIKEKGYPPSVREICAAVGLKSTSTVHGYLERLEKKGLIRRDPTKPRALKVLESVRDSVNSTSHHDSEKSDKGYYSSKELIDVPIVGRVTAGQPILAVENVEDTFPLPVDFVQNATSFMLRVTGESMIDAGILDGDLILVKQQSTANNGDIVVALIEDEATVKTFYKEKDYVRLQPENKYMDPIIVKNVSLLGKVAGVFRKL